MRTLATAPYDVAVYYFPNYHMTDERQQARYGSAWSEWELVRNAKPRFEGHDQPKVPQWGWTDESDPDVMAMKISVAADHGISTFIFDWYWYSGRGFLNNALERGFLKAPNVSRLKFSLMWANHDWYELFPRTPERGEAQLIYPGAVDAATFDEMTDFIVGNYFTHDSYQKIDGCPYFSVYELHRLVQGLGGNEATREALNRFREKTVRAGFPGLHLNAIVWGVQILPGETALKKPGDLIAYLGLDSTTSYVWTHHVALDDFPRTSYSKVQRQYFQRADAFVQELPVPYFPNVTMGWDSSPRCSLLTPFVNMGYPFMPVMDGNTPAAFESALREAKDWVDKHPNQYRLITVNSWNEWTEGSYLEPDRKHGDAYLKAMRNVFGAASSAANC